MTLYFLFSLFTFHFLRFFIGEYIGIHHLANALYGVVEY